MRCQALAIACCLLMSTLSPVRAQSGAAAADPVSGTWIGELAPEGGDGPVSVTFQLKFDGKSAVSGTFTGFPTPGDVKTGTFDPRTGGLKLELGKEGEELVRLVLDGTVDKGVAAGRFTGERNGEFRLAKRP